MKAKLEKAIEECEEKKFELERRLEICFSDIGKHKIEKSLARINGMIFAYEYVITDFLPTE